MKSLFTNNHVLTQTRRALDCYIEPILMYGCLNNFNTTTKGTGGNRNMVPEENAMNLMECKEIK